MHQIHPFLIVQLLAVLSLANGVPLIAKRLFGSALAFPLDNGITLEDGQPLFGHSKTVRGIALSIAVTTLGAPWTGLPSTAGLLVSAMAMIGDLLSSFVKRRMKLVPGSMALALDQIPELSPASDRSSMGIAGLGPGYCCCDGSFLCRRTRRVACFICA